MKKTFEVFGVCEYSVFGEISGVLRQTFWYACVHKQIFWYVGVHQQN